MKTRLIVAAIAGAFAFGAAYAADNATGISKTEYQSQKKQIEDNYKVSKDKCKGMSGNPKDVCQAEAKGDYEVAKKELEASYKPTEKNQYNARLAHADAQYKIAKEKCGDRKGNDKDVCVKEAKADYIKAKGDAKVAKAEQKAADKTASASGAMANGNASKQTEKVLDAKRDAAEDKRDADYKVAKEKCDAMSGQAKDNCIAAAKLKYKQ